MFTMGSETVTFGEWLREQLGRKNLSQADLARAVGVVTSTTSHWVNNKRVPDPPACHAIAAALDIDSDIVLAMAGHRPLTIPLSRYRLDERLRRAERALRIVEEEIDAEAGVAIRLYGRVPADSVRWIHAAEGEEIVRVPESWIGTRSPDQFLVVQASGDCLAAHGILDGHYVLLERASGRQPENAEIVLIRLHDEYTLKEWHRDGDWIELRDGGGNPVHRMSILADFELIGIYVGHWNIRVR